MANIYILLYKINPFSPKTGKYEPEKTPYLDTFHTVGVGSSPVT